MDFGPLRPSSNFDIILLDWLHYRARLIPRRPRRIIASTEVINARVSHVGIDAIVAGLRNGWDMSPWLSDRIRTRKADGRADLLFNDWQISHFHFGLFNNPRRIYRHGRRNILLFVHITPDQATLLQVGTHQDFTSQNLLKTMLETNPLAMERMEIRGVLGSRTPITDQDISVLRKKGASTFIEIDGRLFAPGGGISTSKHATRLVISLNHFLRGTRQILAELETNTLSLALRKRLLLPLGVRPIIGVRYDSSGYLALVDKARGLDLFLGQPLA